MPESKHPVFFVVYVSGAILFLLLMELSRVHDLVMLDRPDTESFITQANFHCTYKNYSDSSSDYKKCMGDWYRLAAYELNMKAIAYDYHDCLSYNGNKALCWYNLEINYALIKRLDKAILIEHGQ